MSALRPGVRAWLELTRLSNLPTVLSNVLAGGAVAGAAHGAQWPRVAAAGVAVAALYVAGMMLNDVADVAHDALVRPERPIPSGRVSRRAAAGAVVVLMGTALALLAAVGWAALALGAVLAACIVAYDLLHRDRPWTVWLMGACRGLVYWVAAASVTWPVAPARLAAVSAAVLLYTVALTCVARSENEPQLDRRRWLAAALPVLALSPIVVLTPAPRCLLAAFVPGVLLVMWLVAAARKIWRQPPQTKPAVLMWISGFCLLDGYVLALVGQWPLAVLATACWVATIIGHRRIAGT